MVLPAVLDPWAASALYEAAALPPRTLAASSGWVSLGPRASSRQVMMTVAQKAAYELVPIDGPIGGFPDAHSTAAVLAETMRRHPRSRPRKAPALRQAGNQPRARGITLQLVGERLGITDQSREWTKSISATYGSFEVLERVEGGKHQVSVC